LNYIDTKYINLVSVRLTKFAEKKKGLYNFRCPYCGDSQKYKNKCRGYLFVKKNDFVFKCHNCGVGRTLANFLKDQDSNLHDQYVMERYKEGLTGKGSNTPNPVFNFPKPKFRSKDICSELTKVSALNKEHFAQGYLLGRGMKDLSRFYFCPNFMEWTNKHKPTFDKITKDEPRIIIPLRDEKGMLFGFQGRALNPDSKLRYITIMLDEDAPKVYGLDKVDKTKDVFVTEGPFDATFLTNSIAMCGSDVDLSCYDYRFVFVFDNEPRNRQIVNKIDKTISQGQRVVIYPKGIIDKDLNDMVLSGLDVQEMVKSNIYSGLEAKLKLNEWKKV
jgi:hypothetical protein